MISNYVTYLEAKVADHQWGMDIAMSRACSREDRSTIVTEQLWKEQQNGK